MGESLRIKVSLVHRSDVLQEDSVIQRQVLQLPQNHKPLVRQDMGEGRGGGGGLGLEEST